MLALQQRSEVLDARRPIARIRRGNGREPGTTHALASIRTAAGGCSAAGAILPRISRIFSSRSPRNSLRAQAFPWVIFRKRLCAIWLAGSAFRWPRSPTARRSASCPMAITRHSSRRTPEISTRRAPSSISLATCLAVTAGVHRFTVGQRKGLGIAAAEPLYVLQLRPADQDGRRRTTTGAGANEPDRLQRQLDRRRSAVSSSAGHWLRFGIAISLRRQLSVHLTMGALHVEFDSPVTGHHTRTGGGVLRRR